MGSAMEFVFTLIVALLCLGSPTQTVKTIASVTWLVILFIGFITSPDE